MTASSELHEPSAARFLVGIDLGTTNSAVAYVDTAEASWTVHDFPVPQLVDASQIEPRQTLPSFHYEAAEGEFPAGALRLPWSVGGEDPRHAVGVFARDHGALVPGRLVVSAKSWLSHSGVDRTAPLLPWHGAADVAKLSPVEVSSRYLGHIRAAWDHAFPEFPLAEQDVVLTVPASFDEVARELTVQAARQAGLVRVVLVEEPQAAFYAWIHAQGADWDRHVRPGQKILVCDVGGGTSDFTLIRVRPAGGGGKVLFHRVAVGEHLILGGDNLDLALAHYVEQRLAPAGGRLPPHQWGSLVRTCRAAKETLLGKEPPERYTITLAGSGSRLIGGSVGVELTREEVEQVLVEGFLPRVPLDAKPIARRSGFQEFGLPYAPDAAITRYLAAFLTAHRNDEAESAEGEAGDPARPDLVLFNGGLFESPVLRSRLLDVLEGWFNSPAPSVEVRTPSPGISGDASGIGDCPRAGGGEGPEARVGTRPRKRTAAASAANPKSKTQNPKSEEDPHPNPLAGSRPIRSRLPEYRERGRTRGAAWRPDVLRNDRLDLAVARGAAYYGMVRRGKGVRITGGLAHSYYVGVQTGAAANGDGMAALCVLPAGVEEGQTIDLAERPFDLLIRQPAEFPLYYSATRTTDRPGQLLPIDPEQLTPLPPIRTVLQSGRKSGADVVSVHLHARLTEIGTLEMWCGEVRGDRQWRLQFDVRSAMRAEVSRHAGAAEAEGFVEERTVAECRNLIRAAFRKAQSGAAGDPPAGVAKRLEQATDMGRLEWPSSLMRAYWETLMEVEAGRRIGVEHEARWLSLTGFCLRPGYGLAVDDWRVSQLWRLYPAGVQFPKNELCRAEWWILWRRVAGGLSAGQQATLADPLVADWRTWIRKSGSAVRSRSPNFQFGPHESAEVWRLLGSLELLKPASKVELGQMLLERLGREKVGSVRDAILFALGRVGARVPVYGPLNTLVDVQTAEEWVRSLVEANLGDERAAFAAVQLARKTGDRYRDVSDEVRQSVLTWLEQRGTAGHLLELVREGGQLRDEEQRNVFGESLPRGLRIE